MWGDSGYQGVGRRQENSQRQVKWEIAMRPGKRRQLAQGSDEALVEKLKASVRAKVGASIPVREAALWLQ